MKALGFILLLGVGCGDSRTKSLKYHVAPMTHPPIRSYVLRQGRFSRGQQRAYEELLPTLGVTYAPVPLDFRAVFGREAPVVVEVGSGMGETTARIAREHPETDYLAIEVH